jgi:hypothetical protein
MEEQDEAPRPLAEKPELYGDLAPVWDCFWFLHPSRQVGMDVGAILLSEIVIYWKVVGFVTDADDLAEKVRLVRAMDAEFLNHHRRKADGIRN